LKRWRTTCTSRRVARHHLGELKIQKLLLKKDYNKPALRAAASKPL